MSLDFFRRLQALAGDRPPEWSRREVLRAALAGAGGLLSCGGSVTQAAPNKLPKIVVVGAGLAGLACADELAFAGYDVIVVEARNRVGGRVETFRDLVPGKTIEGGGELIGPNQPNWMAYAKRFGLKFLDLPWEDSDTIVLDGQRLDPSAARELYRETRVALAQLNKLAEPIDAFRPWRSAHAREFDRQSLDDWIRGLDVSPHCKQLITIQWTGINGLIPAWQSLLGILAIVRGGGLQRFWDDTDTMHCVGGTQQLAQLLARSFVKRRGEPSLRLNTSVHGIDVTDDRVTVRLADGSVLEADDVVFTAPPTTWHKIAFNPTLPGNLVVPMAASTKFMAVVKERIWKQLGRQPNAMSTGPIHITWETTAGQGDAGPHALVAFAGGREADAARGWPVQEREGRYRAELDKLFPGFAEAMLGGRFVDWVSDPWARGTYSFPAPGHVTTVGPLLAAGHHRRLHYAGEHCCYAFVGWMEGALSSGVQTARKLAERDGLVVPAATEP